jgi:pyruvate dehydrogenase E2 component (dihydrolipoyllysine-residue acetyltransferase)
VIETVRPAADEYAAPTQPDWRGRDWSSHEHRVEPGDQEINLCDIGSGEEASLLVHGMGGRWQHWLPAIPSLAEHRRVVALDLPGFGRSPLPRDKVSLELFADCAAAVCRALGITRATFFGHSMGGPIGTRFCVRHPELADGLVFVGGPVYSFARVLGLSGLPRNRRGRARVTAAIATEVFTSAFPLPAFLQGQIAARPRLRRLALWPYVRAPERLTPELAELLIGGAGSPGVFPTARAIGRSEPLVGIENVECPILSINGGDDLIVPMADVERFAAVRPDAEIIIIEGSGHMVMLEAARAFNQASARAFGSSRRE